jgi:hypothetical protein
MPATTAPDHASAPGRPRHPLPALATFELASYRRQLEDAIGSCQREDPAAEVLADLRGALAEVIAEQEDRARIAARHA